MLSASHLSIARLLCVLVVLGSAGPAAAQLLISGGKHTAAVRNNVDVSSGSGELEITVPFRGKRNSFVIVHFGVSANNFATTCNLQASVSMNGTSATGPLGSAQMPDCSPGRSCLVSGTAYFDLDDLEAGQPGVFVKRELTIRMNVSRVGGDCETAPGQWIAQLVKK